MHEIRLVLAAIKTHAMMNEIEQRIVVHGFYPLHVIVWRIMLQRPDALVVQHVADYLGATELVASLKSALNEEHPWHEFVKVALFICLERLVFILQDKATTRAGVRLAILLCVTKLLNRPVVAMYQGPRTLANHVPMGAPPQRVTTLLTPFSIPLLKAVDQVACISCAAACRTYFTTSIECLDASVAACTCLGPL